MKEQISEVLAQLDAVATCFYQQKAGEGYELLEAAIAKLSSLMEQLLTKYAKSEVISRNCSEMMEDFGEAIHALEKKDTVLLADILTYDLMVKLQCVLGCSDFVELEEKV